MVRVLNDIGEVEGPQMNPSTSQGKGLNKDEKDNQEGSQGIGVFFCMLTLISTRIGGGVIGQPWASKEMGFTMSLLLQIAYIPLGFFSSWLLLQAKSITGRASFSDLGIYSYGNISIYIINLLIGLGNLGFAVIFFIVFGDVSGDFLNRLGVDEDSFFTSRWCTQSFLGVALLYLALQKEIHQLKYGGLLILCL